MSDVAEITVSMAVQLYERAVEHFGEEFRIGCSCSKPGCVMTPLSVKATLDVLEEAKRRLGAGHPKVVAFAKGLHDAPFSIGQDWREDLLQRDGV